MSNGRINRTRARATHPENNKIYILICARISSRPTSKESRRRKIGGGRERRGAREGRGAGSGRLSRYEGTSNTRGIQSIEKNVMHVAYELCTGSMNKFVKSQTSQSRMINIRDSNYFSPFLTNCSYLKIIELYTMYPKSFRTFIKIL